jgi:uncharacterized membrane protein YfcA
MNLLIGVIAFISEYLDSGLGMGYGTALAPILILMGFDPLRVTPAILISQFFTDITAIVCHHRAKNVNFNIASQAFRISLLLGLVSSIGVIISVAVAIKIPRRLLTLYIGLLVSTMGILICATLKKPMRFSWTKIIGISFLASFNKGISGGGYGPLVMGGQLISGVNAKNAVGITAFAEAITCLVGFICYFVSRKFIDWKLAWMLTTFAVLAVPLAAFTVKNIYSKSLKRLVGILIIILGLMTLFKISAGG